jgi:hypothetical protein
MIPSINRRIPSDAMWLLVSKNNKSYWRIMWPRGKWWWRGQTTQRSWTNIHICLLSKSPEYHLRIPGLGNCSSLHTSPDRRCTWMGLSVLQILIAENCLAYDRTQNATLCASNYVSAQWKHKSVMVVWICHTYSALTVTYITPTT